VPLFKTALDACDEQNDAWCGRDLMVLSQLFRTDAPGTGKPVQLLSRVYNHALWNKVTFWEEVLTLGVCEAHSAESVWRRTLPAGSHGMGTSGASSSWASPSAMTTNQRKPSTAMAARAPAPGRAPGPGSRRS